MMPPKQGDEPTIKTYADFFGWPKFQQADQQTRADTLSDWLDGDPAWKGRSDADFSAEVSRMMSEGDQYIQRVRPALQTSRASRQTVAVGPQKTMRPAGVGATMPKGRVRANVEGLSIEALPETDLLAMGDDPRRKGFMGAYNWRDHVLAIANNTEAPSADLAWAHELIRRKLVDQRTFSALRNSAIATAQGIRPEQQTQIGLLAPNAENTADYIRALFRKAPSPARRVTLKQRRAMMGISAASEASVQAADQEKLERVAQFLREPVGSVDQQQMLSARWHTGPYVPTTSSGAVPATEALGHAKDIVYGAVAGLPASHAPSNPLKAISARILGTGQWQGHAVGPEGSAVSRFAEVGLEKLGGMLTPEGMVVPAAMMAAGPLVGLLPKAAQLAVGGGLAVGPSVAGIVAAPGAVKAGEDPVWAYGGPAWDLAINAGFMAAGAKLHTYKSGAAAMEKAGFTWYKPKPGAQVPDEFKGGVWAREYYDKSDPSISTSNPRVVGVRVILPSIRRTIHLQGPEATDVVGAISSGALRPARPTMLGVKGGVAVAKDLRGIIKMQRAVAEQRAAEQPSEEAAPQAGEPIAEPRDIAGPPLAWFRKIRDSAEPVQRATVEAQPGGPNAVQQLLKKGYIVEENGVLRVKPTEASAPTPAQAKPPVVTQPQPQHPQGPAGLIPGAPRFTVDESGRTLDRTEPLPRATQRQLPPKPTGYVRAFETDANGQLVETWRPAQPEHVAPTQPVSRAPEAKTGPSTPKPPETPVVQPAAVEQGPVAETVAPVGPIEPAAMSDADLATEIGTLTAKLNTKLTPREMADAVERLDALSQEGIRRQDAAKVQQEAEAKAKAAQGPPPVVEAPAQEPPAVTPTEPPTPTVPKATPKPRSVARPALEAQRRRILDEITRWERGEMETVGQQSTGERYQMSLWQAKQRLYAELDQVNDALGIPRYTGADRDAPPPTTNARPTTTPKPRAPKSGGAAKQRPQSTTPRTVEDVRSDIEDLKAERKGLVDEARETGEEADTGALDAIDIELADLNAELASVRGMDRKSKLAARRATLPAIRKLKAGDVLPNGTRVISNEGGVVTLEVQDKTIGPRTVQWKHGDLAEALDGDVGQVAPVTRPQGETTATTPRERDLARLRARAERTKPPDVPTMTVDQARATSRKGSETYYRVSRGSEYGEPHPKSKPTKGNLDQELGLSVYPLGPPQNPEVQARNPHLSFPDLPADHPANIGAYLSEYAHLEDASSGMHIWVVKGRRHIALGADGEPILRSVKVIGKLDPGDARAYIEAWKAETARREGATNAVPIQESAASVGSEGGAGPVSEGKAPRVRAGNKGPARRVQGPARASEAQAEVPKAKLGSSAAGRWFLRSQELWSQSAQLRPKHGEVATGGGAEYAAQEASAIDAVLSGVRKGLSPDEAASNAKTIVRSGLERHNARRPNDVNWQVDAARYDSVIDRVADDLAMERSSATKPATPQPEVQAPPVEAPKPRTPVQLHVGDEVTIRNPVTGADESGTVVRVGRHIEVTDPKGGAPIEYTPEHVNENMVAHKAAGEARTPNLVSPDEPYIGDTMVDAATGQRHLVTEVDGDKVHVEGRDRPYRMDHVRRGQTLGDEATLEPTSQHHVAWEPKPITEGMRAEMGRAAENTLSSNPAVGTGYTITTTPDIWTPDTTHTYTLRRRSVRRWEVTLDSEDGRSSVVAQGVDPALVLQEAATKRRAVYEVFAKSAERTERRTRAAEGPVPGTNAAGEARLNMGITPRDVADALKANGIDVDAAWAHAKEWAGRTGTGFVQYLRDAVARFGEGIRAVARQMWDTLRTPAKREGGYVLGPNPRRMAARDTGGGGAGPVEATEVAGTEDSGKWAGRVSKPLFDWMQANLPEGVYKPAHAIVERILNTQMRDDHNDANIATWFLTKRRGPRRMLAHTFSDGSAVTVDNAHAVLARVHGRITDDLTGLDSTSGRWDRYRDTMARGYAKAYEQARQEMMDLIAEHTPPGEKPPPPPPVEPPKMPKLIPNPDVPVETADVATWEHVENAINGLKAIKASADMSAVGRQGLMDSVTLLFDVMPDDAGKWFPGARAVKSAFMESAGSLASQRYYDALKQKIANDPVARWFMDRGLYLATQAEGRSGREELYSSTWAERIPVAGEIVKASERSFNGYLDPIRLARAKLGYRAMKRVWDATPGMTEAERDVQMEDFLDWVNNTTGRGPHTNPTEAKWMRGFGMVLFSPRFKASRVMVPVHVARAMQSSMGDRFGTGWGRVPKAVRGEIYRTAYTYAGVMTAILGGAKLAGMDVNLDPADTRFGTVGVGKTRMDLLAGFRPMIRQAYRGIANRQVTEGKPRGQQVSPQYVASPFIAGGNWLWSGNAPIVSGLGEYGAALTRTRIKGLPSNAGIPERMWHQTPGALQQFIAPLAMQDVIQAWQKQKQDGTPVAVIPLLSLAAFFGVGMNTVEKARKSE